MLESVFQFFDRSLTEFTWRRVFFIVALLGILGSGLILFEYYTGHFRLGRIERSSAILRQIVETRPLVTANNFEDYSLTLKSLHDDLNDYTTSAITPFNLPVWFLKSCAAAVPWLAITLITVFTNKHDFRQVFTGIIILALFPIVAAAFIPTFEHAWISYGIIPLSLCIIPVVLATLVFGEKKTG